MKKNLKKFFGNMIWSGNISSKKLNIVSIIFVVLFDIFLFYNIKQWYEYQRDLINRPSNEFACRDYFYDLEEDSELLKEILNEEKRYASNLEYCVKIKELAFRVDDELNVENIKFQIENFDDKIRDLQYDLDKYEREYEKYKDELSSWINSWNDRLSNINGWNAREKYFEIKKNLDLAKSQKNQYENSFNNRMSFFELKNYLQENKGDFFKAYKKAEFWYPVKVWLFQLILILPLFLFSVFFYKFSLKKDNRIFKILFANLSFITGIFVFILLFKFLYFIAPKKFFVDFIKILRNLNLGFIWNYILVILWVVLFGLFIYLSQKWADKLAKHKAEIVRQKLIENKKKFAKERFFKWQCIDCWKKLLDNSTFCSHCGFDQYSECEKCGTKNPKSFEYCNKCGRKK